MEKEIFKDIKGYEGIYQISNNGRVYSIINNIYLKPGDNGKGYMFVNLRKNKIPKQFYVHRLVAIAFLINPENKSQVNHKDCNKSNNYLSNLEWCTLKENMQHASKNNRMYTSEYQKSQTSKANRGINSALCKITEDDVINIKKLIKEGVKTQKEIGDLIGTTRANISAIKRGVSWKHITI